MMFRQIAYRLAVSVPVVFCVMLLGFSLMMLVPSDPAAMIAGEGATPELLAQIRADIGLDRPALEQFARYSLRVLHGDFGKSIINGVEVLDEIMQALPATVELLVFSMLIAIPTGIAAGALAARAPGSLIDRGVMSAAAVGISMPVFMTGLLLINVFGVKAGLFPVQGRSGPFYTLDGLMHLALPSSTLAVTLLGPIARMVRTSMLEVARKDFVRTAMAKGISEQRVLVRHTLRNALIPTVNLIGLQLGYLLGGVVVTETIFAWPGMGRLAVGAILSQDTPMAQGTVLFIAVAFVVINIVVDFISAALDPRTR